MGTRESGSYFQTLRICPFPEDEGTDLFCVTDRWSSGQQVPISIISVGKNVVTSEWFRCPEMPAGSRSVGVSERRVAVHLSRLTWAPPGLGKGSPCSFSRHEAAGHDPVVASSLRFSPIDTSVFSVPDKNWVPQHPTDQGALRGLHGTQRSTSSRTTPPGQDLHLGPPRETGGRHPSIGDWVWRPAGPRLWGNTPPGSPRGAKPSFR